MKITVMSPRVVDVGYLIVEVRLPQDADDERPDIPFMIDAGGVRIWRPMIDVDKGKVMGWAMDSKTYVYHDIEEIKTLVIDRDGELIHSTNLLPGIIAPISGEFAIECEIDEGGYIKPWDKKLIVELLNE